MFVIKFVVKLKVPEFLYRRKLSALFEPNGRWAKGHDAIVASAILAGLTPPDFRDDVRRRAQDASSDTYRVVQLMDKCCGKSGRQSTNIIVVLAPRGEVAESNRPGTGFSHSRDGGRTVRVPLEGLMEKAARATAQMATR